MAKVIATLKCRVPQIEIQWRECQSGNRIATKKRSRSTIGHTIRIPIEDLLQNAGLIESK